MIGHIDSDCFYVSCERIRRPELRGIPVGVMSNQGACVIAKSYELRAKGVGTAMAIWDAKPLCPEAVYVKRDFEWYEVVSRKMLEVVRSVSPAVEYYSIDEQFFDASYLETGYKSDLATAVNRLQQEVLEIVGIPVSIGVAPTKTIAKLISNDVKPFGTGLVRTGDEAIKRFGDAPVDAITGIAKRSKNKLLLHSISNCAEFAAADRRLIRKLLTKTGEELWWELRGTITKSVMTERKPNQFISRGGSVGKSSEDGEKLLAWVARNIERLIETLDFHEVFTEELTLILRQRSGLSTGGKQTLPQATSDFRLLFESATKLFNCHWQKRAVTHSA